MTDTSSALPDGWLPEGTVIQGEEHVRGYVAKNNRPRVAASADVYTLACERIAYVMDNHDRVAVSFSGGKDSTAVLNIALQVAHSDPRFERHLPLRVVHFDEEAIPIETEEYVRRVAQRPDVALEWYCLPVKHRNACSRRHPYWWPWAPEDQERWCRPLPPEAITSHPAFPVWPPSARMSIPQFNGPLCPPPHTTAMLMGIRAQESRIRAMAVRRRPIDNYIVPYGEGLTAQGNIWKAYPIYDWRTEDVWAAARVHSWDYNRAYDLMEMAGVTPYQQRCSPAVGEEPLQKLHMYAQCFPDVWARMAERVPGVGAAYRYARTELYGFLAKPPKPDGMTWPDFITHYLSKHDPRAQPQIAERIREAIARHYRQTTHPILPKSPHPATGLNWNFLLNLAMRGDFKKRRQEVTQLMDATAAAYWRKYTQELAQILTAGTGAELGHPRALPSDPYALIPAEYAHQERP
ncbi:phosphoadenosine phosphosulfate reductase domain-containing protein [Thermomonospora cellulosilytica]|uniref:Putative phosphoadenosine phosphosulfate sulfurtransferase n=1 Tax=Thermomonospora cellulosilytica TaxID=1411118 RepID=A0A7W3RB57_9ACTN|nr:phosphoadenosine phosphosulfate reductase family protein [Thermomonospora cellulosilytica]MBA9005970.1 putative phosphoadenosine phosphosulfate sulfurtransferase [Thermomonospora cellulosilytica]